MRKKHNKISFKNAQQSTTMKNQNCEQDIFSAPNHKTCHIDTEHSKHQYPTVKGSPRQRNTTTENIVVQDLNLYEWAGHLGYTHVGGQSGAAVTRPHGNHQDVGSNPATARNEKNAQWADPCTEGVPIMRQDLSGRLAM